MAPPSRLRRSVCALTAIATLVFAACSGPNGAAPVPTARRLIVFMTDFGTLDDAVAICKGVMLNIAPAADIIDITHHVTPYSISEGARLLARTAPYYPAGTVFVTVIDPGVGTARRSIVVKTKRGQFFVLPDNGLITPTADRDGVESARLIENPEWLLTGSSSSTFHGRDVYSPVGAHLARGEDWTRVGPIAPPLVRLELQKVVIDDSGIAGSVVALDGPFGNLVTNVGGDEFRKLGYRLGEPVRIRLGDKDLAVPFVATFGDVAPGKPLLFVDSRGLVSLAINQGNFAQANGITPPGGLFVFRK